MTPDWLKSFFTIAKDLTIAVVLFISCLVVLLLPDTWTDHLGVTALLHAPASKFLTFLIGLVSLCAIGVAIVKAGSKFIRDRNKAKAEAERAKEEHEHRLRRLHDMTPEERQVMRYFKLEDTRSQTLTNNAITAGLVNAGIVYMAADDGDFNRYFKPLFGFNISEWAREEINRNPGLLLSEEQRRDAEKDHP